MSLENWFDRLSPDDKRLGRQAYSHYRRTMLSFSEGTGISLERITAAFVALSPNNDLHGNLRSLRSCTDYVIAKEFRPAPVVSTYGANAERAVAYLKGARDFWLTVGGPKIKAFYLNILYPDLHGPVTVDGHIAAIYAGRDDWTMRDAGRWLNKTRYREIEHAVADIAYANNMIGSQAQAALWFCRKRTLQISAPDTDQASFFGIHDLWASARTYDAIRPFPAAAKPASVAAPPVQPDLWNEPTDDPT